MILAANITAILYCNVVIINVYYKLIRCWSTEQLQSVAAWCHLLPIGLALLSCLVAYVFGAFERWDQKCTIVSLRYDSMCTMYLPIFY